MSGSAIRGHLLVPVADTSSVGEARRSAQRVAESAELDQADAGRVSIIVTELATNLALHARPAGGVILLAATGNQGSGEVEIFSIDAGPGMADISKCFNDGFSTSGTPGNGLGAVKRLSDDMDLFSTPAGTVIWARVVSKNQKDSPTKNSPQPSFRTSGLSISAPGEEFCGDSWRVQMSEDGQIAIIIADGLGHGPLASDASNAACDSFNANPFTEPRTAIEKFHTALAGTRGAAVVVAQIDPKQGKVLYAGVGNIAGTLIAPDGSTRGLFSHNGTVGHQLRKVQTFEYPWSMASLMVLHSDGLQTRWTFDKYPGLAHRHPSVIAGVLYRDFKRGRDDISVVIISAA